MDTLRGHAEFLSSLGGIFFWKGWKTGDKLKKGCFCHWESPSRISFWKKWKKGIRRQTQKRMRLTLGKFGWDFTRGKVKKGKNSLILYSAQKVLVGFHPG